MKRFIFAVLTVSVFFLGVGALVEKTGARFKSDEKALALIAKARVALGGEAAINNVQSLRIVGRTTQKVNLNGVESMQDGETEIAMQFPDKFMKSVRIGKDGESREMINQQINLVTAGDGEDPVKLILKGEGHGNGTGVGISKKLIIKKDDGSVQELTGADAEKWIAEHPDMPGEKHIIIKKGDGSIEEFNGDLKNKMIVRHDGGEGNGTFTSKDGKTFDLVLDHKGMAGHEGIRQNDMLRLTLSLLLTAPKGMDVEYTSGGDADLDGTACNVVVASFGGQSYKLFLDASSSLPIAIAYKGVAMPKMMTLAGNKEPMTFERMAAPGDKDVITFTSKAPEGAGKANLSFKRVGDQVDYLVKFSDYRSTGGVQLPYRWTQTASGNADETFDVNSYEINPSNIAEKFQGQKVLMRSKKPEIR